MSQREENPFEDELVAKEWINSVENEQGLIRDNEIYPLLRKWAEELKPKTIVEIGAGQGVCADKVQISGSKYIGVEPSEFLVQRAEEKNSADNREFILGSAYSLPFEKGIADAVFSVGVWFHLGDLATASKEMNRIMKSSGEFLIVTANPDKNSVWESFYVDAEKIDNKVVGKVMVPVNPLSKNIFHLHTLEDIKSSLNQVGLEIKSIERFGKSKDNSDLFIAIRGRK